MYLIASDKNCNTFPKSNLPPSSDQRRTAQAFRRRVAVDVPFGRHLRHFLLLHDAHDRPLRYGALGALPHQKLLLPGEAIKR